MGSELFIRDVPAELRSWIDEERQQQQLTQREFLISLLRNAHQSRTLPLPFSVAPRELDPESIPFKFIDLFAGIGGFRVALQKLGGTCVFSSEWDRYSQKTYKAWHGEMPHGDIRKIPPSLIPDHDVLAAGFPCQPFSIAGVSKKVSLGREHGFKCTTQGTLFFTLASIIEIKRPPVVILENVKNLKSHDSGRTWRVIWETLSQLEYSVHADVIDAAGWVPQHRERVYIVCFDKHVFGEFPPFSFPTAPRDRPRFGEVLEKSPDSKYTLTDHLWNYLQEYARKHREKGNGFGYGLASLDSVARTLSARYHKDGSEILIPQKGKNPRRLTPRECARLMGFDDSLPIVVSDTQAYRQFGNAVVPKVVEAVFRHVLRTICWKLSSDGAACLLKGRFRQAKAV